MKSSMVALDYDGMGLFPSFQIAVRTEEEWKRLRELLVRVPMAPRSFYASHRFLTRELDGEWEVPPEVQD
jgi:hypothetical protein